MKKILMLSLIPLIIIFLLISSFRSVLYDINFYKGEYKKNGVYDFFGEEKTLNETKNLFNFLMGKEELSEFFNQKEKLHMNDVKDLIKKINNIYWLCIILGGIFFFLLYRLDKKKYLANISKLFIISGGAITFLAILFYFAKNSFSTLFIKFHLLFFNNDLWLLNPETDNLINLFPQQFFFDIFYKIILTAIISGIVLAAIGVFYLANQRKISKYIQS